MAASWCRIRTYYEKYGVKLFRTNICRSKSIVHIKFYTALPSTRSRRWLSGVVGKKTSSSVQKHLVQPHVSPLALDNDVKYLSFSSVRYDIEKDYTEKVAKPSNYEIIKYDKATAPGEKKDTSCPLPKAYSPQYVEAAWYDWWVKEGFFSPEYNKKHRGSTEKFIICLPPPNVTGTLHLGHALTNSIQDALVRWNRMRGIETLWLPGCDHAGIATQVVVEKKLWREQKKSRHDLGREKFIQEIWKWKEEKGETIYEQMKKLGSSLDWSRSCFTMDDTLSTAVTEAFVCLHDDGLIYRNNRLVNWSCQLQSVISDIEVENVAVVGRTLMNIPGYEEKVEFGTMTSFAYPVVNSNEEIVVSTTRPETMLGDTAIAVHPEDFRYIHLHEQFVQHPFEDRQIPIICDESVDQKFGTGAVKITPAHDHTDFEIGTRHNLPSITVIDSGGRMVSANDRFNGMKRFDARSEIVSALKEQGLYKETKDHDMTIPLCSRSHDVIEPLLMEQWYVDCQGLASQAIEVVKFKELTFSPQYHEKVWLEWMLTIRDWCISRQIWWGHRIPAYYAIVQGQNDKQGIWVSGRNESEALTKAATQLQTSPDKISLKQDDDVLDTWFSSALFPFSALGWPKQTKDLQQYYPTSLLETGSDIMFFWVARMVMLGLHLTNRLPFSQILLHGLLKDAHGRKMSKSLGNVIDPLDVITGTTLQDLHKQLESSNLDPREIETARNGQKRDFPDGIPECGTDALRFTLCSYDFKSPDINMNVMHVQSSRHFCNKIWQSFKFVNSYFDLHFKPKGCVTSHDLINQWILSRLHHTVRSCDINFKSYDLQSVTKALQNFWLVDFCDFYIEYVKPILQSDDEKSKTTVKEILFLCTDTFFRSLSPIMPFLTEELYQRLPHPHKDRAVSICVAKYSSLDDVPYENKALVGHINTLRAICTKILSVCSDYGIKRKQLSVYIQVTDPSVRELFSDPSSKAAITVLSHCKSVDVVGETVGVPDESTSYHIQPGIDVAIMLKGIIDPTKEIEKLSRKLQKSKTKLEQHMKKGKNIHNLSLEKQDAYNKKLAELECSIMTFEQNIKDMEKMK